jgi:hypothetical protein
MPTLSGALTTLDVSLEPSDDEPLQKTRMSSELSQLSISLLRCVVLTRHLERIVGAIERAIPCNTLSGMHLSITQSELEVNGRPAVVFSIEAAARLRRLRTRVLKAIAPGTVVVDASPSVSDFLSPFIGPIVLSDIDGRRVLRSPISVRTLAVYEVAGPSCAEKKLLRRWAVPAPKQDETQRR